jgi:tetratricopeptide (TPR) repeat protein
MTKVSSSFALLIACLLSTPALAAEPSVEARRLYAEGKAAYAQARYEEAISLFERSYGLSESPALLFNMAQAHRLAGAGHCRAAVTLYKSYLSAEPEAENKQEVEERIAELGDCAGDVVPSQPSAPPAPTVPSAVSRSHVPTKAPKHARPAANLPTGPVLLTGAGAALLVAGGVLYARAWDKHREAERICPCYPGSLSDWEVLTNISYVLLAVGGATTAGGVTWWAIGGPKVEADSARAMVGVSGHF